MVDGDSGVDAGGDFMPAASASCTSRWNAVSSKLRPGEVSGCSSPSFSGRSESCHAPFQRRFSFSCFAGELYFSRRWANSRSQYFRASSNVNPCGCIFFHRAVHRGGLVAKKREAFVFELPFVQVQHTIRPATMPTHESVINPLMTGTAK